MFQRFQNIFLPIFCILLFGFCGSLSAANRYWVAGSAGNWNDTGNWSTSSGGTSGASVPGNADVAIFDGNGLGDCAINANVDVSGFQINSGYTGSITQNSGISITIGSSDFIQSDGTFIGGDTFIDINGIFTLNGGDFTSTSATMTIGGTFSASTTIFVHSSGSFSHNSGTLEVDPYRNSCSTTTYTLDVLTSTVFYDLDINASQSCSKDAIVTTAAGDTVDVSNDLTQNNGFINGLWEVDNDLYIEASADGGYGEIIFNSATAQEYFVDVSADRTCKIVVDKTAGGVTPGTGTTNFPTQGLFIYQGDFTAPSGTMKVGGTFTAGTTLFEHTGGTYTANGGTLEVDPYRNSCSTTTYTLDVLTSTVFYDLDINASQSCSKDAIVTTAAGDTVDVSNDLTQNNGFINGLWEVDNDLYIEASADGGYGEIIFNSATAQEYFVDVSADRTCKIVVDKTAGGVTPGTGTTNFPTQGLFIYQGDFTAPSGTMKVGGTFTAGTTLFEHTGGTYTANGGTLEVDPYRNSCSTTTYTLDVLTSTVFYDLDINASQSCSKDAIVTTAAGDTVDVSNDLTQNNGFINGLWEVDNDLYIEVSADGGYGEIIFNSATAQEYFVDVLADRTCKIVVDKTAGGVTPGTGTTNFPTQGLFIYQGDFTAPSGTMKVGGTFTAGTTLFEHTGGTYTANGGTLEVDPYRNSCSTTTYTLDVLTSTVFYDLDINASQSCSKDAIVTTAAGDTVDVSNDLTQNNGFINGLWEVDNDLYIEVSADGGYGEIIFNSATAQEYFVDVSADRTCKIVVDKTAGGVTPGTGTTNFPTQGLFIYQGDFTAPSGTMKVGGTFTAGTTLFEHTGGTYTANNGTLEVDPYRNSCSTTTYTLDVLTSTVFYDLDINASQSCGKDAIVTTAAGDTVDVSNDLIQNNGFINGLWEVDNDLYIEVSADGGYGEIIFNSATAQEYFVDVSADRTCKIVVDKTAGGVTPGTGTTNFPTQGLFIYQGDFTAPSGTMKVGGTFTAGTTLFEHTGGTYTANGGTLEVDPYRSSCSTTTYTLDVLTSTVFYDLDINASQSCGKDAIVTTAAGDTVDVSNDLTQNNGFINGLWEVDNDLYIEASADGGYGKIMFNSATAQEYFVDPSTPRSCIIEVDKSAGGVTSGSGTTVFSIQGLFIYQGDFTAPPGQMNIGGTFTANTTLFEHNAGNFIHNNTTVEFDPYRSSCSNTYYTIDVLNSTAFYNVTINGSQSCGKSGIFLIPATDTMMVANDLLLSNGQVITGFMEVQEDATVESTYDGGDATLIFSGPSTTQKFDLTNAVDKYNGDLQLNKTFGPLQVTLLSDLMMDQTGQNFDFLKGQILSDSTTLLTIADNVSVSNASDSSFVNGLMRKIGDDAFSFPVGKDTTFAAIEISKPLMVTDTFDAEYFHISPHPLYDRTLKEASLYKISHCEYWTLNRNAGGSDVSVTLTWAAPRSCGVKDLPTLSVARWDGALWVDEGNGGVTGGTGSGSILTLSDLSSFGPFTISSTSFRNSLISCSCCNKSHKKLGRIVPE